MEGQALDPEGEQGFLGERRWASREACQGEWGVWQHFQGCWVRSIEAACPRPQAERPQCCCLSLMGVSGWLSPARPRSPLHWGLGQNSALLVGGHVWALRASCRPWAFQPHHEAGEQVPVLNCVNHQVIVIQGLVASLASLWHLLGFPMWQPLCCGLYTQPLCPSFSFLMLLRKV